MEEESFENLTAYVERIKTSLETRYEYPTKWKKKEKEA